MITLRPMEEADVPGAVEAFDSGFLAMRARYGMPVTAQSLQEERRRQNRTRHFLSTDPEGSWVADDDGLIVGMSQSFIREGYWTLSQLGTVPGRQGRGLGRELLRLALSHGDQSSPGTIQCSRDPKAMALYSSFGFELHPVVAGWGPLRPGTITRPEDVTSHEAAEVTDAQLDIVTAIDRAVRGSARTVDVQAMLAEGDNRLLLHGDQAYAVAKDERIVTLGALNETSAALVLRTMLAEAPDGETIEVNWLTSAQQWAIGVLTQAGIELQPYGPVMVRGMAGPPSPYIPSGGYG
ncbi:MAG TPA: GNAT family N-acetyltransferase [Acidimicrobiales bacterium]|nr:GNAT family N-acetyltransferase [Acidimicrobiales bacterium]